MHHRVFHRLPFVFANILLASMSCGIAGAGVNISCSDAPQTVSPDIPNSIDLIISDMALPHEGYPHGVPPSYDWAKGAVSASQGIPQRFHAMVAWGQLYEDICGNPADNTRVQVRDIRAYVLSKKDNEWHLLQSSWRVVGAAYKESFVPPINRPGDMRKEPDGSISVKAGGGFNFHFYAPSRAIIDPGDVAAIFTSVQARLVVDDPSLPDDRERARYLLNVGADLWRNETVEYDKEENSPAVGMGRFRYVTTGWQSFNMLYMEGGINTSVLRRYPPPVAVAGG